jgi:hypothetical protein
MAMSAKTRGQVEQVSTLDRGALEKLRSQLAGDYQRSRSQTLTPEVVAELTELAGAIETVSKELEARQAQDLGQTVAGLDEQVAAAIGEGNAEAPTTPVVPAPTELHEQLAALDSRVGSVSGAAPPTAPTQPMAAMEPTAPTGWRARLSRIRRPGQPGGGGGRLQRILFPAGLAAALLGIILVVVGIVAGVSSASSDRSSASQDRAATRSSLAQEQSAAAIRDAITRASTSLSKAVSSLTDADNALTHSEDSIIGAFNNATGLSNAGNTSGAIAGYQSQTAAIADVGNKLKADQAQLAAAQQSLGALQAQVSQR